MMRVRHLIAAVLLIALPGMALADPATTQALQQAIQRLRDAQRGAPPIPAATLSGLHNSLQMMTRDQVDPALFQVDQAIFNARLAGLREMREQAAKQDRLSSLQRQVQSLTRQQQSLQAEYGKLREQLANMTMSGARTQHLQAEIQQQKQMLQLEEQRLAGMANQQGASASALAAQSGSVKALTVYAQVRAASDGVHVTMPVNSLFGSDNQLSASGKQRLQAISRILKQTTASEILVRVAPQPLGANVATQRAETILRALRRDGIPDQVLALATGAGLSAGTAELLLANDSPTQ
jgi:regulator of replication initiation timing